VSNMIRIAQIGCGYWGPNLLRNLVFHPGCEAVAVADRSPERRAFVQKLYPGLAVHDDALPILDDPTIEAVVIATPAASHHALALRALERGKHILVEKPMARTVAEVTEIDTLARERQRVAMVGHTFLFNPAVRFLRGLIDAGGLGDLRYLTSQRLNLGRIRDDVDVLWNLGPHDLSIIDYLLKGQAPESIVRRGMDFVQPGIDDVVFLNLAYPGKLMAHVHLSWLEPLKVRRLVVVGSEKMAVYDDLAEYKIAIYDKGIDPIAALGNQMDFDEPRFPRFTHRNGDVHFPKIEQSEPLRNEIDHFLASVRGETECLTDCRHAASVIAMLERAENGR